MKVLILAALAGVVVLQAHQTLGLTLVGAAMGVLLGFTIIEPATNRAAFQR